MAEPHPLSAREVQLSKLLAHALRHDPGIYGLTPDPDGWVTVDALLTGLRAIPGWDTIDRADVVRVVLAGDKQRYELDERIRASYGHSLPDLVPQHSAAPPERLYHGTTSEAAERIATEGLRPMRRQHVHLSVTFPDARRIGQRHTHSPVVLVVDAVAAHHNGHTFYATAEPRVWLADCVPAAYLRPAPDDEPALRADHQVDGLQRDTPEAAELLRLCAFFAPATIPVTLLRDGGQADLDEPLAGLLADETAMRSAISQIGRYGLAEVDTDTDTLRPDWLVGEVLRAGMDQAEQTRLRTSVHQILTAANPWQTGDPDTWPRYAMLTPHILPTGLLDAITEQQRRVVLDQTRYLYRRGDYEGQLRLAELATARWDQTLGREDLQTIRARFYIGGALRELGRANEALTVNTGNLEVCRAAHGPDHPMTRIQEGLLAADLRLAGRFADAAELDQACYLGQQRVLGDDHQSTMRAANNLGISLRLLGRFAEAKALDEANRQRRQRLLARWDTERFTPIAQLARDLYGLGDPQAAHRLLAEELPDWQARLGADHPVVLAARRTLGVILRALGDYPQAAQHARQVAAHYTERFGEAHPDTLAAATTLISDRRLTGALEDARTLGQQTLDRYRTQHGVDHPFTHVCAVNLAIVLRAAGEHPDAHQLDTDAHQHFHRQLGAEHPYTLTAQANLTNDLAHTADHHTARDTAQQVYDRSVRVRGADHPDTLAVGRNLAIDRRATGDPDAAQTLRGDLLARHVRTLGRDHPDTVAVRTATRAETTIEPPPL